MASRKLKGEDGKFYIFNKDAFLKLFTEKKKMMAENGLKVTSQSVNEEIGNVLKVSDETVKKWAQGKAGPADMDLVKLLANYFEADWRDLLFPIDDINEDKITGPEMKQTNEVIEGMTGKNQKLFDCEKEVIKIVYEMLLDQLGDLYFYNPTIVPCMKEKHDFLFDSTIDIEHKNGNVFTKKKSIFTRKVEEDEDYPDDSEFYDSKVDVFNEIRSVLNRYLFDISEEIMDKLILLIDEVEDICQYWDIFPFRWEFLGVAYDRDDLNCDLLNGLLVSKDFDEFEKLDWEELESISYYRPADLLPFEVANRILINMYKKVVSEEFKEYIPR